jgi:pimeloyl-ACP methyl ester carboxylesterase
MRLHMETAGDGPRRIALIHGLGADAEMWADLVDPLVADGTRTVLMPELRGHGASPRADSYRIDEFVGDLVETLPTGLDAVLGHSLGGALLVRAAPQLHPARAVYLDPGFRLGLPATGLGARLYWGLSRVTIPLTMLASRAAGTNDVGRYSPANRDRVDRSKDAWDRSMVAGVFRELTFAPTAPTAPVVPSTIVLSAEGSAVLPDPLPAQFATAGWEIRRAPSVGHPFWMHDAGATMAALTGLV